MGKGDNRKSLTVDPCIIFDWIQKFWLQASILPPAEQIKILPENSFSEVSFNKKLLN